MLENILHDYFDLPEDWNDNAHDEAENWYKAYDKLIKLIYALDKMGVMYNAVYTVNQLDKIDSEVIQ